MSYNGYKYSADIHAIYQGKNATFYIVNTMTNMVVGTINGTFKDTCASLSKEYLK